MKKKITITTLVLIGIFLLFSGVLSAGIFGYNDLVGTYDSIINTGRATKAYLPESGEITKITAGLYTQWGSATAQTGIYDLNLNLIALTETRVIPTNTTGTWYDFTFSQNPTLNSGWYWLVIKGSSDAKIGRVSSGASSMNFTSGLIQTLSGITTITRSYMINASYDIPPPPPPPPPSYFILPSVTATSSLAYVGRLFTDLSPFVYLAIGLPLGFWIINKSIGLVLVRVRKK